MPGCSTSLTKAATRTFARQSADRPEIDWLKLCLVSRLDLFVLAHGEA